MSKKSNLLIVSILVNVVFFVLGFLLLGQLDIHTLRSTIVNFGILAPLIYITLYILFFIIPFNPFPKNIVTYIALISFGPFIALLTTLLGDIIGILFNYFIGSRYAQFLPSNLKLQANQFSKQQGWWLLTLSRIIPITEGFIGADFPSYAAGVVKMPLPVFILATMLPWIIIDMVYFYSLNILLSYGRITIPFLLLFFLSLVVAIYKFTRSAKK